MKTKNMAVGLFTLACLTFTRAAGRGTEELLAAVEGGNLELIAARELLAAQKAEARTGNTLPDPELTYDYLWGSSREVGNSGELNFTQGFELPWVYASRSRHARATGAQAEAQYSVLRGRVLLEALRGAIELDYLRARERLLRGRLDNARRLAEAYSRKAAEGEVSRLEAERTAMELAREESEFQANAIDIAAAVSLLSQLAGGEMEFVEPQIDPLPPLPALGQVRELWQGSHPAMIEAAAAVKAAGAGVEVSRREALPKLEAGFRSEHALGQRSSGVKMGVSIPLFESRGKVRLSLAKEMSARAGERSARGLAAIEAERLHARATMLLDLCRGNADALAAIGWGDGPSRALAAGAISLQEYHDAVTSKNMLEQAAMLSGRDYRIAIAELLAPSL